MRTTLHITTSLLLALSAGACGDLANEPFRVGTVRGQLTEYDPAVALVSLVGQPGTRTTVDAEGRFAMAGVPAGPAELFIVATPEKALRLPVTVPGGQSLDVKAVKPNAAGFLEMRVKAPRRERVSGAQVSVEGTPFQRLLLDDSGQLRVGPLPDGCYTVTVSATGFPDAQAEACLSAGETKELKVDLEPEPGKDGQGCAVTGCEDGLVCAPGNRCVECYEDSQCGEGLSCKGFRCEGPGPQCAPCDGDWKCQAGTTCQDLPAGGTACVAKCAEDSACDAGFTCQGGRCLPDAARYASCHALLQLGMPCDGDARCQEQGLTGGVCAGGACTVPCATDRECPGSFLCEDSAAGRVCRPRG